jgi:hypothetical protein
MSPIATDKELGEFCAKAQFEARKISELVREGKWYDLMKTLSRIEISVQLAQQRLAELP